MSWGNKIFVSFLVFGAIMITMVVISFRQDVGLVAEDYYEQEINYQDQIDRKANFKKLDNPPAFRFDKDNDKVYLEFPSQLVENKVEGKVHFFRPSAVEHDKIFPIELSQAGTVEMNIEGMIEGMWILKVDWSDGDREYYFEKNVYL